MEGMKRAINLKQKSGKSWIFLRLRCRKNHGCPTDMSPRLFVGEDFAWQDRYHSGIVPGPESRRLLVDSILRFDISRRNIHRVPSAELNQRRMVKCFWCVAKTLEMDYAPNWFLPIEQVMYYLFPKGNKW